MRVISLSPEYEKFYCVCLEDWSDEMKEAGDHKETWLKKMRDKGLRVKLALDDKGEVGGMIQYVPIEESFVEGKGLYFILCIWVHGHKRGRGNFQKKGMGTALLKAAKLFDLPAELFTSGQEYTKDPLDLLRHRAKAAEMIEKLMR